MDIIDQANDRAARDLDMALHARPLTRLQRIYSNLRPDRVCKNCGEALEDGNALFCPYVAPGEDRPACCIDFEKRHG